MTDRFGPTRRGLIAGTAAGAVTLALSACGAGGGEGRPLRIGYQKNNIPLLAKVSGRADRALEAAGFATPDWRVFTSGPPLLEALGAGAIDIGQTGDGPPIFAQAAGAPLRYVAAIPLSGAAGGVIAPAQSPVETLEGLKGRRLALTRGSSAHAQAAILLGTVGLTLGDVEIVNLGPADGAAAFARGDMDAWVIWDPYYTSALDQPGARVVPTPAGALRSAAFVLAHADALTARPEEIRTLLNAFAEEARAAEADKIRAAETTAQETGLDLALARKIADRADYALVPMSPEIVARQQEIADVFAREGELGAAIVVADAVWTGWSPP